MVSKCDDWVPGGVPIMNAAHGFQTNACEVSESFKGLLWVPNYTSVFSARLYDCWETRSHSLFISGNRLSCFWRFCWGRHIKENLPHLPSGNTFFSTFPLLFQIFRLLSSIFSITASPIKAHFSGFNKWMFTLWDPHFPIFPVTPTLTHMNVLWLTNRRANQSMMQPPPSPNLKLNVEKNSKEMNLFFMDRVWF